MAVSVQWIEEPWILEVNFGDEVTVDDMRAVIRECVPALKEHPIYFLIDMSAASNLDPRIFELSSMSEWIYHPNGRWFAYIRPLSLFKAVMKSRQRGNFKAFEEREVALNFLHNASRMERVRANLF